MNNFRGRREDEAAEILTRGASIVILSSESQLMSTLNVGSHQQHGEANQTVAFNVLLRQIAVVLTGL